MTIGRFTNGASKIDLDGTTYSLGADFYPPAVMREYNLSHGTSLNRYGGAELIGSRAVNRELEFSVVVQGTTEIPAVANARRLVTFLRSAKYFEWQPEGGLPEPLWGQLGAWLRYEIVTADASLSDLFGMMNRDNLTVNVVLKVKPHALGARQSVFFAAGGTLLDMFGVVDGNARGLMTPEATTNKMTDPTFEAAWTVGSSLDDDYNYDRRYVLHNARRSVRLSSRAGSNNTYTKSINVGNTNTHTFSAYVMRTDGAAVTSSDCQIYYADAKNSTYTSMGNGLYRVQWSGAGINSATAAGIIVTSGGAIYLMGYQIEEKAYATPLCFGDLPGCAWTGTQYASTSTRTTSNILAAMTSPLPLPRPRQTWG